MEGIELREGRERVELLLIAPLIARGMTRPANMRASALDEMLERLRGVLAYMAADKLEALAEIVARRAGGKARDRWPAEVSVCNWAADLQSPPASESRLVRSYMASAAGRRAYVEGYEPELFLHLKRAGLPPKEHAVAHLRDAAGKRQLRVDAIRADMAAGRASPADRQWLGGFLAFQDRVRGLVNTGPAEAPARAVQAEGGA